TYYLRSRPATKIAKTTVTMGAVAASLPVSGVADRAGGADADADAIACSLENPGSCEACQ
ncbi:MAG TPA: hypothetical protein DCM32_07930, partial [Xanthomonadaceae bacterium]|nr:hypothetical protein [Xanthomonadaceae bacterium]